MATVTITGSSDDIISVGGDIREEFYALPDEDGKGVNLLAFSDGTVLRVVYDQDGIWRITRVAAGSAEFEKQEGVAADDTFDVVILGGDIRWVVHGDRLAIAKR